MSTEIINIGFETNNDNEPSMLQVAESRAIEISYIPVETSVTMKKVKEREEAKAIMNILKN